MSARREPPRRVTAELIATHTANARRLRLAAQHRAFRRIGVWLMWLLRWR